MLVCAKLFVPRALTISMISGIPSIVLSLNHFAQARDNTYTRIMLVCASF